MIIVARLSLPRPSRICTKDHPAPHARRRPIRADDATPLHRPTAACRLCDSLAARDGQRRPTETETKPAGESPPPPPGQGVCYHTVHYVVCTTPYGMYFRPSCCPSKASCPCFPYLQIVVCGTSYKKAIHVTLACPFCTMQAVDPGRRRKPIM